MNKILICCEKRWVDALLNNSPIIDGELIQTISQSSLNKFLFDNNITIVDDYDFRKIEKNFDIIIIDDLSKFDRLNKDSKYYFITPIDFNISDGFISQRWPEANFSGYKNLLEWANIEFPNLYFLSSNIFYSKNQIFDLSLVLNLNNQNDNWGLYHYSARDLFKSIRRKEYRLDYCFREVKKENRVLFLLNLLENLSDEHHSLIKISAHGGFLNDDKYFSEVRQFFENENELSTFLEFIKLDKKFFSFDKLINFNGFYSWATNKLLFNTLSSDISIYFETAREKSHIRNTMNYLITEKTIDLLNIGKPFIHLSQNVDVFLKKFGFKNYTDEIFDGISENKIDLIKQVCQYDEVQYEIFLNKLTPLVEYNLKLMDGFYKKNMFLFKLVHK